MREAEVAVIYGTRPEAIKLSPVVRALRDSGLTSVLTVSTHQHTSLLDDTLAASHLTTDIETAPPQWTSVQDLVATIGINLQALDLSTRAVVVQGDTVTAYAGALFGFLNNMLVVHIEAGLRTSTLRNPFPEEGLRRAITQITDLHLAPTPRARRNLEDVGVDPAAIVVTGNTSIDALLAQLELTAESVTDVPVGAEPYCVVTLHRRESWGAAIGRVATAIGKLATSHPHVTFLCPLHPNPTVRREFETVELLRNVLVIDPLPHDSFVQLLRRSCMIITDSGGIQEEATVLGVPTLVARDDTERPEAVEAGVAHIVGTDVSTIVDLGSRILGSESTVSAPASARTTFGDGKAGVRCARAITAFLNDQPLPVDMMEVDH